MIRGRFGLLLALLVLLVGAVSFGLVLALLDDDPGGDKQAEQTTTTASSTTTTTVPVGLTTPTFVAVVSSEDDEATAQAMAAELTERGYDSSVLRSDEYASLDPGFWVAYVGPFGDAQAATAAADELIGDGYGAAYARCVGTAEECG